MGQVSALPRHGMGLISLTYDGLLRSHVELALPALDAAGLKGTFFGDGAGFAAELVKWLDVAKAGHELGNGALLVLAPLLGQMTPESLLEEVQATDELLSELTGTPGPFPLAWPIGSPTTGHPSFAFAHPSIVRTGLEGVNREIASRRLKCIPAIDLSGSELIEIARWAQEPGTWIIFVFDGIGEGERGIDRFAHRELLDWLSLAQLRVVTLAEGTRVSKIAAEDV